MRGRGNGAWSVSQPGSFESLGGGAESAGGTRKGSGVRGDHRCLSSALYMAKPSTANTVAPTLALSQKVEFFRSA